MEVLPQGMERRHGIPGRLLAALAERGWSDDDLAKLTSGNILRVMREAEAGARALQRGAGRAWRPSSELDGLPA